MLQDGSVKRYPTDDCLTPGLRLCPYRNKLRVTADEFLWNAGIFTQLGRFDGLDEEMRSIVLHSLREYPLQQIATAVAASADQLRKVATGYGMHDRMWHTYGIIERYISEEVPAMHNARQQRGELDFKLINRLHVPVAFGSMLFVIVLLLRAGMAGRFDPLARLAATPTVATLAHTFACGAGSGPDGRDGGRHVLVSTFNAPSA